MELIDSLINEGWLKTPRIIGAFRKIKRADFLPARTRHNFADVDGSVAGWPDDMKDLAELNEALSIGYGQTISQPLVVAFMMELLQPSVGEKILDIGSGSGWTTALLSEIVGNKGKVIAIEIVPELKKFGEKNVEKYNFLAPYRTEGSGAGIEKGIAEFICADGSKGYKKEAPYDKILASAAIYPVRNEVSNGVDKLPSAWKEQLKIGGRIVTPIGSSIWLFIKKSSSFAEATKDKAEFEEIEYPGFAFVPLIEK